MNRLATRPGVRGPGALVFEHALELALDEADESEAVAELLGLARGDRATIEAARYRFLGLLDDLPGDADVRGAVTLLEKAMRRGSQRGHWAEARA